MMLNCIGSRYTFRRQHSRHYAFSGTVERDVRLVQWSRPCIIFKTLSITNAYFIVKNDSGVVVGNFINSVYGVNFFFLAFYNNLLEAAGATLMWISLMIYSGTALMAMITATFHANASETTKERSF